MMNKNILLIGGGGHCKSVLDSLLESDEYSQIGIIDTKQSMGNAVMGIPVIGCDDDIKDLFDQGYRHAFITLGSIGSPFLRVRLHDMLNEIGFEMPSIMDTTACISKNASLESGVFVGKRAVINAGALIKKCAIINTGAIIEHDCLIGEFAHIAPGAVIGGGVKIGQRTHIGSNTAVRQQIKIGEDSIIGMGSVVTKDIGDNVTAYGNPAREINRQ